MTKIYLFPGQGSQKKGMGAELFDEFPEEMAAAERILGYSMRDLCVEDPDGRLTQTQFTQPALFVVSVLTYMTRLREGERRPDFVAGHSVGEYAALFASGAFDFMTGLRLIRKRGELMSQAHGGGMAAVIGMTPEAIRDLLESRELTAIDVANLNSPQQIVISGLAEDIARAQPVFEQEGAKMFIPLPVSGAFHSRYMEPSSREFESFIRDFTFSRLTIPVISNVTARPYEQDDIARNLVEQITSPVRWTDSIRYLLEQESPELEELGPGNVLTSLTRQIRKAG